MVPSEQHLHHCLGRSGVTRITAESSEPAERPCSHVSRRPRAPSSLPGRETHFPKTRAQRGNPKDDAPSCPVDDRRPRAGSPGPQLGPPNGQLPPPPRKDVSSRPACHAALPGDSLLPPARPRPSPWHRCPHRGTYLVRDCPEQRALQQGWNTSKDIAEYFLADSHLRPQTTVGAHPLPLPMDRPRGQAGPPPPTRPRPEQGGS